MAYPPEQQTILIVDDAKENIRHLAELLGTKYSIRVATTGERALDILMSEDQPDLVLLDVDEAEAGFEQEGHLLSLLRGVVVE